MPGAIENDFFFDAGVHLDRVVHPNPEQNGQCRDRRQRERDAEVADEAERPNEAYGHDEEGEESPADAEGQ